MEMTRSILKHMQVPNYMWGEATRHSTYLLIQIATRAVKDRTPYEMYRSRKPNIGHLRTFGCIGYANSVKPHLKKLEDKSCMLVHLRTEPGSKAYRMYYPISQRIIVSRDVVFDEAKGWNWSQQSSEGDMSGTFVISFGDFGNHGIEEESQTEQNEREEASDEEAIPNIEEEEVIPSNNSETTLRRS